MSQAKKELTKTIMLAKVFSASILGIDAYLVEVEVDIFWGLPGIHLVGLPDTAVQESRERVRSAIKHSGFQFPGQRITINMAPANTRKSGPAFDLAIALGMLIASEQLNSPWAADSLIIGELSLDGSIRPVQGTLAFAMAARANNKPYLLVPRQNAPEAAVVEGIQVYAVDHLEQAAHLISDLKAGSVFKSSETISTPIISSDLDYAEVKGQQYAKRGLEIAAAGGHNLLMVGPPGSGKTMLARRLPGILPPMSFEESLETSRIHSISGLLKPGIGLIQARPFRAPHHSVSNAGLVGGSSIPRPGEVSLAHHGVLFLDELLEFRREALEVLRQPLEDAQVTISRAQLSLTFPADFMFVASMNPCPCGFRGDNGHICHCTDKQVERYWGKLSGPLLDRIDIHLEVPRLQSQEMLQVQTAESSAHIQQRVIRARKTQLKRFLKQPIFCNAQMSPRELKKHCELSQNAKDLIKQAIQRLGLSARSYDRTLKLARTIADLDAEKNIHLKHLAEAIQFRVLDRGRKARLY